MFSARPLFVPQHGTRQTFEGRESPRESLTLSLRPRSLSPTPLAAPIPLPVRRPRALSLPTPPLLESLSNPPSPTSDQIDSSFLLPELPSPSSEPLTSLVQVEPPLIFPILPPTPLPTESPLSKRLSRLERELSSGRLPIVRYLPIPEAQSGFNQAPTSEWLEKWVHSDLPSVCIEHHNACCHICLMDYEEPPLGLSYLVQTNPDDPGKQEPLRQLACRHVFHQLCIDTYLQSVASGPYFCPMCHQRVITLACNIEEWKAEFNQLMSTQREDVEHAGNSDIQEGDADEELGSGFTDGPIEFDENGLPILSEYSFEKNNKYLNPSPTTRSFLKDAKILLEQNGNLSEAALLLEAAIQGGDLGQGGYEAWILLGETRNMDQRGEQGIRALAEGVRRAQAADGAGAGMFSLAVSYMAESCNRACRAMLLRWLRIRFPTSQIPERTVKAVLTHPFRDLSHHITDVFLSVARTQYSKGAIEPELHIGLGALFYCNIDHDRARICYGSALATRPEDYVLWNRLGCACFDDPSDADVFKEAVRLRSTYTRAFYNLGLAYLDAEAYWHAAEQFLTALALQESAGEKASEDVWSALQEALPEMHRGDLADISTLEAGTSLEVYRKAGFNF